MGLYTKNGVPLQLRKDIVYSKSGKTVGKIKGNKVFGTNGKYVGTIVGDRLVYRSSESGNVGSSFSAGNIGGSGTGHKGGSGVSGEEPNIPN